MVCSVNRVGALLSLKAFYIDGKNTIEAVKIEGKARLTSLESVVKERLKR